MSLSLPLDLTNYILTYVPLEQIIKLDVNFTSLLRFEGYNQYPELLNKWLTPKEQYMKMATLDGNECEYSDVFIPMEFVSYMAIKQNNVEVIRSFVQRRFTAVREYPLHYLLALQLLPESKQICDLLNPLVPERRTGFTQLNIPSVPSQRTGFARFNISSVPLIAYPWENPAFLQYIGIDWNMNDQYLTEEILQTNPIFKNRRAGMDYPEYDVNDDFHVDKEVYLLIQANQPLKYNDTEFSYEIINDLMINDDTRLYDYALVNLAPVSFASLFIFEEDIIIDEFVTIDVRVITTSLLVRARDMQVLLEKYPSDSDEYHYYMSQLATLLGSDYTPIVGATEYLYKLARFLGNEKMIQALSQGGKEAILSPLLYVRYCQISYNLDITASSKLDSIYPVMQQNALLRYSDRLHLHGYPLTVTEVNEYKAGPNLPEVSSLDAYRYLAGTGKLTNLRINPELARYLLQRGEPTVLNPSRNLLLL